MGTIDGAHHDVGHEIANPAVRVGLEALLAVHAPAAVGARFVAGVFEKDLEDVRFHRIHRGLNV